MMLHIRGIKLCQYERIYIIIADQLSEIILRALLQKFHVKSMDVVTDKDSIAGKIKKLAKCLIKKAAANPII